MESKTSGMRIDASAMDRVGEDGTIVVNGCVNDGDSDVGKKCLDEIDLLKLELLNVRISENLYRQKAMSLEADRIESDAVIRVRAIRQQVSAIDKDQHGLTAEKNALIDSLNRKYQVNFRDPALTYNTSTGIITEPRVSNRIDGANRKGNGFASER